MIRKFTLEAWLENMSCHELELLPEWDEVPELELHMEFRDTQAPRLAEEPREDPR